MLLFLLFLYVCMYKLYYLSPNHFVLNYYIVPPIMLHAMVMLMTIETQKRKKFIKIYVLCKERVELRYYFIYFVLNLIII